MARAKWTEVAESDLDDLIYYIGVVNRSAETAERIYAEIRDQANRLAEGEQTGHRHPDAPESWRYVKHKRWLIFFQHELEGIRVMRVIDGVRDLPERLLES